MKTIGLLGGMSWESTQSYYRIINQVVARELGGLHSAKCLLYSMDFAEIEQLQSAGEWERSAEILADAARALARGGAEFLVICTNTMHKLAPEIESAVGIPLLHIADLTADELIKAGIQKVGLLGTRYTMEQEFYRQRLTFRGIDVLIPNAEDRQLVNRVIYDQLCRGIVDPLSRAEYLRIIETLAGQGAQGMVLGCTEIGLLVSPQDTPMHLFDTAQIHAERAALYALGK